MSTYIVWVPFKFHDLTALPHRFAWNDYAKAINCVATRRVNAMARADAGDDERVHLEAGEHLVEIRPLKRGRISFEKNLLVGASLQAWIECEHFFRLLGIDGPAELDVLWTRRISRIIGERGEENRYRCCTRCLEDFARRLHDRVEVAADLEL